MYNEVFIMTKQELINMRAVFLGFFKDFNLKISNPNTDQERIKDCVLRIIAFYDSLIEAA